MSISVIGWDVGGAHVKAAGLDAQGRLQIEQEPCPLWLGLDQLEAALDNLLARLQPAPGCHHAVTMTGELVDCFASRSEGVMALVEVMCRRCAPEQPQFFAGIEGFVKGSAVNSTHWHSIASANWLATGAWAAACIPEALLVDIGSTTTDVAIIHDGHLQTRGYTDHERMRYDELVYTGVVRTPLMAVSSHLPFAGESIPLMAEHFATTADVYRLTLELPETSDQAPTADGGEKNLIGSARRLARAIGSELESASLHHWQMTARFLRERQIIRIQQAMERQLSLGLLKLNAPFLGAGVGRFLVRECATRLGHPYQDISELFPPCISMSSFKAADCAPAAALACLVSKGT